MAAITFKTKLIQVYNVDDTPAFVQVNVPEFTRSHCDMAAFRSHPKFGGIANSDLFKNVLTRIRRDVAPMGWWKLDSIPANVSIDSSGFLAKVTIEV